ncbi:MAG: nitroreductase [Clostridiales bacterium]|nr:nitroreductase [Clostridiales bacterium]
MELKEMITKRKSTRNLTDEPVSGEILAKIRAFMDQAKPLFPEIKVHAEIVDASEVRCMQPWKTPHFIAVYTEDSKDALINVGFLFQQVDLYIQSLGLGVCWVGMGKPRKDSEAANAAGLTFAILLPFGHGQTEVWRDSLDQFSRKPLAEIADQADPRLEPVRLAPSATNSQPWYFTHAGDQLHVYQVIQGPLKRMTLGKMNCIDMGIGLCHLALTGESEFALIRLADAPQLDGYEYIGTVPAK